MGKRMERFKKGTKRIADAYDDEMTHLIDDCACLIKDMSKN